MIKLSDYLSKDEQKIIRRIYEMFNGQWIKVFSNGKLILTFKPKGSHV